MAVTLKAIWSADESYIQKILAAQNIAPSGNYGLDRARAATLYYNAGMLAQTDHGIVSKPSFGFAMSQTRSLEEGLRLIKEDISTYPRYWEYIFKWTVPPNLQQVAKLAAQRRESKLPVGWYHLLRREDLQRFGVVNPEPLYVDNTGVSYYGNKDPKDPTGLLLGELALSRQPYDPIIRYEFKPPVIGHNIPLPPNFNVAVHCNTKYHQDPITLEDLADENPNNLYVHNNQCYDIRSTLERWERGFSLYDGNASRVTPQYPADIDGFPIDPQVIADLLVTAQARGIDITPYPLVRILNGQASVDVYEFINKYVKLTEAFNVVAAAHPKDLGVWNRRDLIAQEWLNAIYEHNGVNGEGGRRYQNILSTSGREGTQVFYQCFLSALFVRHGYRVAFTRYDDKNQPEELHWIYDPNGESGLVGFNGNLSDLRDPARGCVRKRVVT